MRPVFMQLFTMNLGIMAKRNIIIKEFLPPQSHLSAATASLHFTVYSAQSSCLLKPNQTSNNKA